MHSRRGPISLALVLVVTLLLGACGPKAAVVAPTAAPAERVAALEVTAAPTLAPTVAPTLAPTDVPTKAPTVAPTKAPTVAPAVSPAPPKGGKPTAAVEPTVALDELLLEIDEDVAEAYSALLIIDACATAFEDMATAIEAGEADPEQTFGAIIILSALLDMEDELLAEGPPDPALQEAWDEALLVMPLLRGVTEDWYGGEITAAKVTERLEPVHAQIDHMIALADDALVSELGADPEELALVREMVREEIAKGLQETMSGGLEGLSEAEEPVVEGNTSLEMVNVAWHLDFSDDLVFIGEVTNAGEEPVGEVQVQVTLVGEKDEVLATESGMTLVSVIEPGGVAPFIVDFLDDPGEFADYEIVIGGEPLDDYTAETYYSSFSVTRELDRGVDGDYFGLLVEAENEGDEAASMVEAIVTAYDTEGKVVGVGSIGSEQNRILPGEIATFDIGMNVVDDVASHTILFDGYKEDVVETPDLEITNITWLTDYFGDPFFVGEVRNNSSDPAGGVMVVVTIDDADGELAGADSTYSYLDIIPAGGSSPFHVTFWDTVPEDGDFVATVEGNYAEEYALEAMYDGLEVVQHSQRPSDDDELVVAGRLENVGDLSAQYIKVVLTGWDEEGDVVAAASTYLDVDELAPGDTAPFEIETYMPVTVEEYDLQVEGSIAD